jgi:hypothetical protein
MKRPTDQYGNRVPTDLVVLDDNLPPFGYHFDSHEEGIRCITAARWYRINGILAASAAEIDNLLDTPIEDVLPDWQDYTIFRIDDCLKRYDPKDGFYHA